MPKNPIPTPPETDNPIIVLRAMSLHQEYAFLNEFMAAYEARDVDRAAKCALAALSSSMERKLVDSLVSSVNNLAHAADNYSTLVTAVLCKAADRGFHQHAYNAANQIVSSANTVREFKEAERYFKMAMAFSENPALQAAAHVNYCPIVRDGMITGKPDWPAAVEIYEVAARTGLVKAMFNAGNVSEWLTDKGDRAYGARAAYWFKYALDHRAAGKPTLDMETPDELEEVYGHCMLGLSACHIDAKFDGADLDEGIRWAKIMANKGDAHGQHNLCIGYMNRLTAMTAEPQSSPGANWRSVLSQLDWTFKGSIERLTLRLPAVGGKQIATDVDKLLVEVADGSTIPFFVTYDPCLPCFGYASLLDDVSEELSNRYPVFLMATRKAWFLDRDGSPFTPIYVYHQGQVSVQSLWVGGSPALLLQQAEEGVDFFDKRFSNSNCMIPIAVNVLDEGFVVAERASPTLPWVGVGGPWRMPFSDEAQLHELGIALRR